MRPYAGLVSSGQEQRGMNAALVEAPELGATVKLDYDFAQKYEAVPLICPI
jgi:hypothetical protein